MEERQIDKRRKDGKAERRSFCPSVLLSFVLLLLCAACAAVKPAQQADRDFYKDNSQKMGVNFSGTESKELIKASSGWMGTPYRYGGEAKNGVDCSGFVFNVFREAYGITLPRNSAAMSKQVRRVSKADMQCGDLVFFTIKDKRVSHVGIYMGDNKFVHSSASYGVSVANLGDAYWSKYFSGAGRVAGVKPPMSAEKSSAQNMPKEKKFFSKTNAQKNTKASHSSSNANVSNTSDTSRSSNANDEVIIVFDEEF